MRGTPVGRLRRALAPRGTVVFVGDENGGSITGMSRQLRGAVLSLVVKQRLAILASKERAACFERLTDLIEAGVLTVSLDRTFPLEEAARAVRLLESGQVRGKVTITL